MEEPKIQNLEDLSKDNKNDFYSKLKNYPPSSEPKDDICFISDASYNTGGAIHNDKDEEKRKKEEEKKLKNREAQAKFREKRKKEREYENLKSLVDRNLDGILNILEDSFIIIPKKKKKLNKKI